MPPWGGPPFGYVPSFPPPFPGRAPSPSSIAMLLVSSASSSASSFSQRDGQNMHVAGKHAGGKGIKGDPGDMRLEA